MKKREMQTCILFMVSATLLGLIGCGSESSSGGRSTTTTAASTTTQNNGGGTSGDGTTTTPPFTDPITSTPGMNTVFEDEITLQGVQDINTDIEVDTDTIINVTVVPVEGGYARDYQTGQQTGFYHPISCARFKIGVGNSNHTTGNIKVDDSSPVSSCWTAPTSVSKDFSLNIGQHSGPIKVKVSQAFSDGACDKIYKYQQYFYDAAVETCARPYGYWWPWYQNDIADCAQRSVVAQTQDRCRSTLYPVYQQDNVTVRLIIKTNGSGTVIP